MFDIRSRFSDLSIHDLTRRSTFPLTVRYDSVFPFNSRPHKEVDGEPEGDGESERIFQFTTSQGGRPTQRASSRTSRSLSIHDLTRRSTLRIPYNPPFCNLSIHDLTRRSTAWRAAPITWTRSFNSRPHKEVDDR